MGEKFEIVLKVCCVCLVLYQGTMLNLYLSHLHNYLWWSWYLADMFVITVWIVCLLVASRRKYKDHLDGHCDPTIYPDEIRYAYIAWFTYACFLCPRVVLLFEQKAQSLVEKDILGPNFLKSAVACTPFIFLLLARSWHDAKPNSKRKYVVMSLASIVTLDLFDSIDLLDFLFIPFPDAKSLPAPTKDAIPLVTMKPAVKLVPVSAFRATLVFACINFFLPTFALAELKVNRFRGRIPSIPLKLLYDLSFIFIVNIPNLIIRSVLWHKYNMNVSVLIMKNVMCIAMGTLGIYDFFFSENKPKKCSKCRSWFNTTFFAQHKKQCVDSVHERMPLTGK